MTEESTTTEEQQPELTDEEKEQIEEQQQQYHDQIYGMKLSVAKLMMPRFSRLNPEDAAKKAFNHAEAYVQEALKRV